MTDYPALISPLNTPKVLWYQTDVSIVLRIMLIDVKDYFLLVDMDHLRFSTINDRRKYYLCIYLFGAIVPEKCIHSNTGREIRVTIPKAHKWTKWLRLCIDKQKNPHITIDHDQLQKEEFILKKTRWWDSVEQYKSHNVTSAIQPAVSTTDEESDDEKFDALFAFL